MRHAVKSDLSFPIEALPSAPIITPPRRSASLRFALVRFAPFRETPRKTAPSKFAFWRSTSLKVAPNISASVKSAPLRVEPVKFVPAITVFANCQPSRFCPSKAFFEKSACFPPLFLANHFLWPDIAFFIRSSVCFCSSLKPARGSLGFS